MKKIAAGLVFDFDSECDLFAGFSEKIADEGSQAIKVILRGDMAAEPDEAESMFFDFDFAECIITPQVFLQNFPVHLETRMVRGLRFELPAPLSSQNDSAGQTAGQRKEPARHPGESVGICAGWANVRRGIPKDREFLDANVAPNKYPHESDCECRAGGGSLGAPLYKSNDDRIKIGTAAPREDGAIIPRKKTPQCPPHGPPDKSQKPGTTENDPDRSSKCHGNL